MQRLLSHPLTIALFTALAIIFYVSLDKSAQTVQTSSSTLLKLEEQNKKLGAEVAKLEEQVETAQTGLSREKIIRNELLLQKPGEYVVQLPDGVVQPKPAIETEVQESPWEAWKKVLL